MSSIVVTLDVSRLSGWLNAFALCRVERRACDAEGGAVAAARAACKGEGPTGGWGAGHAAERTANMALMSVTMDVSRLSGWLNASAPCAESKGSHEKERGMWAEKGGVGR